VFSEEACSLIYYQGQSQALVYQVSLQNNVTMSCGLTGQSLVGLLGRILRPFSYFRRGRWCVPIIPATWESEIKRMEVPGQRRQKC
jgi:hypothetical protein